MKKSTRESKSEKSSTPKPVPSRYELRDVHKEIDLYDRKIADLHAHQTFATEDEKNTALDSLNKKRQKYVNMAQDMKAQGVEFNNSELPRSFRSEEENREHKAAQAEAAKPPAPESKQQSQFGKSVSNAEQHQANGNTGNGNE